jgi:hypothetical protein
VSGLWPYFPYCPEIIPIISVANSWQRKKNTRQWFLGVKFGWAKKTYFVLPRKGKYRFVSLPCPDLRLSNVSGAMALWSKGPLKSSEECRWPKATSPPQELFVWGPEGLVRLVFIYFIAHATSSIVNILRYRYLYIITTPT